MWVVITLMMFRRGSSVIIYLKFLALPSNSEHQINIVIVIIFSIGALKIEVL